jgi:hypothetical protein
MDHDVDEEALQDRQLIAALGARIAVPRAAPADSFVLHAPLELLARAGLLPYLRPADRDGARRRLHELATAYEAAGDPVEAPAPAPIDVESLDDGAARLVAAIAAGDLDDVDRLANWVGAHATAIELRQLLARPVAPLLGAAAHAGILLYLLPRVALASDVPVGIVRGAARELAREPGWRLSWFDHTPPDDNGRHVGNNALVDRLSEVPMLGIPGSTFIYPTMHQAEESGIAAKLLADVIGGDPHAAGRDLARVATLSMLQEPPTHAPYGWTHCLTMPQAVIALADHGSDPRTAIAVAATYVVGFRAALGERVLDPEWEPPRPATTDLAEAIEAGPAEAAAMVWHAPASSMDEIVTDLAPRAALHHDAHLVKYTLACFVAAATDPSHRRLHLAAAASLSAWWTDQPNPSQG